MLEQEHVLFLLKITCSMAPKQGRGEWCCDDPRQKSVQPFTIHEGILLRRRPMLPPRLCGLWMLPKNHAQQSRVVKPSSFEADELLLPKFQR